MQPFGFTVRTSSSADSPNRNLQTQTFLTAPPDDDNDAVKAVVGVLDVAKQAESQELQQHLKTEEAGEHHVTDLQNVCQLLRLKRSSVCEERKGKRLMCRDGQAQRKNEQINRDRQTVRKDSTHAEFLKC